MLTPIKFTTTSKDRPLMILDGYLYNRDRRTYTKTYWRCENQKSLNCHYRLHTCNSTSTETHILILKQTGTHSTSCNRDLIKITLRKFRKDVLDRTKRPDRVLIFSSPEQTAILKSACDFLMDRTVDVVPEIFYQLYVIHAVDRGHVIPVVSCLLQRKSTATYKKMINKIVEFAPTWSPRTIMLGFEKAVANVLSNNFPQACLSGCYFHLRQKQGLQKRYEDDVGFAHGIHKVAALAFINPNDVINAFADLSTHLGDGFQSMLDYFEDTYIARFRANGSRARPLFNIEYWNVYERAKNQQMRTNNSADGWDRRISTRCVFQCSHPTLWKFIDKLILEKDSQIHTKIARVNAGEPTTKKKKY
ncbi:unnamed protein product [Rotaria socialis]|uniref:MULE transposase domain-containing protein n=1 Tax=Rotaria socialis TaxID=392032 RepID=A0A818R1F3_9BILA|nr:unnamed protein product [Rotaria socialis]